MDFPIIDLIDEAQAISWLLKHFHPKGLHCPHCGSDVKEARPFGTPRTSRLQIYRCFSCEGVYNLYSGTVFQQTQFTPSQAVLLLRGIRQGVSSAQLGREIGVSRQTVMSLRRAVQSNAEAMQPGSALRDRVVETDEMFQNAGEKGDRHQDPADPPRDAVATNVKATALTPPTAPRSLARSVVRAGACDCVWHITPMRLAHHTDKATLTTHVHQFTRQDAIVYTGAWRGYNSLDRSHEGVCHGDGEWGTRCRCRWHL